MILWFCVLKKEEEFLSDEWKEKEEGVKLITAIQPKKLNKPARNYVQKEAGFILGVNKKVCWAI